MNCRPGDKALIIATAHAGKGVTCVRLLMAGEGVQTDMGVARFDRQIQPVWIIDRKLDWYSSNGIHFWAPICPDEFLMPIRPGSTGHSIETDQPAEVTA